MERIPKGVYTPEFRSEAVKLVEATGMTASRAARQLSMPKSSLSNWIRASRKGQLEDVGKGQRVVSEQEFELVHHRRFATREQAKRELTEYIEIFYNRMRKQARLGYLSPAAYMQQYHAKQMAA
jgi:transposase